MLSILCFIFFVELELLVYAYSPAQSHAALELDAFNTKPNKSMVVATLPLRLSLCKLASVATGKTKDDLKKILENDSDKKVKSCFSQVHDSLKSLRETDLILLNKIYVNYSNAIDSKFTANSSGAYGVDVERVSFNMPRAVINFINTGTASSTYRRIRDVIDATDITTKTKMVLLTAAYFKATWEVPFTIKQTKFRKFHTFQNKILEIPMMVRDDSFLQYEDRNYKVLTTKLRSSGASFTIVVPVLARGLPGFLSLLKENPNLLQQARDAMTRKPTKLVLPRFKIKTTLDYTDIFRTSSLKEILNTNSTDLNSILSEESRNEGTMYVNKIKQKIFLEVDEFGVTRELNNCPPTEVASRCARHPRRGCDVSCSCDFTDAYNLLPEHSNAPLVSARLPVMGFMAESPRSSMSISEFVADRPFYFSFDLEEFVPKADYLSTRYHQLFCGVYYGPE